MKYKNTELKTQNTENSFTYHPTLFPPYSIKGFTLVETLVAIIILTLGIVTVAMIITSAVKVNQKANLYLMAKDVIEGEVERLSTAGFPVIDPGTLTGSFNYFTWQNLKNGTETKKFALPGIPTEPPPGFDYSLYRPSTVTKVIGNKSRIYPYTLMLCVQNNYRAISPIIDIVRFCEMRCYWMEKGKLKRIEGLNFIVGQK